MVLQSIICGRPIVGCTTLMMAFCLAPLSPLVSVQIGLLCDTICSISNVYSFLWMLKYRCTLIECASCTKNMNDAKWQAPYILPNKQKTIKILKVNWSPSDANNWISSMIIETRLMPNWTINLIWMIYTVRIIRIPLVFRFAHWMFDFMFSRLWCC